MTQTTNSGFNHYYLVDTLEALNQASLFIAEEKMKEAETWVSYGLNSLLKYRDEYEKPLWKKLLRIT